MKWILKSFIPVFALVYLLGWTVAQSGSAVVSELTENEDRLIKVAGAVSVKDDVPTGALQLDHPSIPRDSSRLSADSLPTLNIPRLLAGHRHAVSAGDPHYLTQTFGFQVGTDFEYIIYPQTISSAISIAVQALLKTGNTITSINEGHAVSVLGYFQHTQYSEYPLGIALEGKCENVGGGTMLYCVGVESQLSANNGNVNFIGLDAQVTSNNGNLSSFFGMKVGIGGNTQIVPIIEGVRVEDMDSGEGEVLEINGLHFENQTRNNALVKRAIWVEDPEAVIETVGRIKAPGITVQTVNAPVSAGRTGTGRVPADGTRPQNHEGTEFMTVVIMPKDPENILRIEYEAGFSTPQGGQLVTALFRDGAPDTLDAKANFVLANTMNTVYGTYETVAGTTAPITFRLRAGLTSPSLLYMNTLGGQSFLGDSMHSYIRVTERRPNASVTPLPGG